MNGKAAKRIRNAVKCFARPEQRDATITRLKREYETKPYHQRDTPKESHSHLLKRYHAVVDAVRDARQEN